MFWYRYVDDCVVIIKEDFITAGNLLNKLNNLHPRILFTLELEQNKTTNFLNLSIKRFNDHFEFGVYRKPTTTDHLIHFDSRLPHQYKISSFYYYVNNLSDLPFTQSECNKEIKNILNQFAVNNGYGPDLFNHLILKIKSKKMVFLPSFLSTRKTVCELALPLQPHF